MSIENLPDDSRVWIYGFNKKLNQTEIEIVKKRLQSFVESWQVHSSPVKGGFKLFENQFVLLATNDSVSGCSIDSSIAIFKELKQVQGLDALDQNLIFFKNEHDEVQTVSRSDFQKLVNEGRVTADTKVFNLMLNSMGQIKKKLFESTFSNSWHKEVFKIAQEVT